MSATVEQLNSMISTGNTLGGFTQGVADLSRNPTGADQIAALLNLAGAVGGAIGSTNSPFLQALGGGLGVQASALGVAVNGVQLASAINSFNQAMATDDMAARAAAQAELADKAIGLFAAIGGTMAAIPVPAVQQIGLAMWLGGTAAQQVMNGNAQKALDMVGSSISESIANLVGGEHATVRQYVAGTGEVITVELFDRYGVSQGEEGRITGAARTYIEGSNGRIVSEYLGDSELPTSTWFEPYVWEIHSNTIQLDAQTYQQIATRAEERTQTTSNTVDFAANTLFGTGIAGVAYGTESEYFQLMPMLQQDSLSSQYSTYAEWFDHDSQGGWYAQYGDAAESHAYYYAQRLGEVEEILGVGSVAGANYDPAMGILSPIALDLSGDGITTISLEDSKAIFDIDGDGRADHTGWLSPNDAFLARDVNGDGRINSIHELFGGAQLGDGYARLSELDTNGDLVLNEQDPAFAELLLWQDQNANGTTDSGELHQLAEMGVTELGLAYEDDFRSDNGNLIVETSSAQLMDQPTTMADVYFRYEPIQQTFERDHAEEPDTSKFSEAPGSAFFNGRPRHDADCERMTANLINAMSTFAPSTADVFFQNFDQHKSDMVLAASQN